MYTPKEIAQRGTFLVREVGSTVHGTCIENFSDLDLMGVCFQPPEYLLGLCKFEQYTYSSAKEGEKSRSGDINLVVYSIQKFLRLAMEGNPSILVFFFSPKRHAEYEIARSWADGLDRLVPAIVNVKAGYKFLGYLRAQKERLLGQRGQMRVTRTELIEAYGYDVKYAYQSVRLGLQGIEYLETGKITLPIPEQQSTELKRIRNGEFMLHEVVDWIENLENELERAIGDSLLPKNPDKEKVNRWLVRAQLEFFEWRKANGFQASLP